MYVQSYKFACTALYTTLKFFADFCAYVAYNEKHTHHIITANEGNAIGLAVGYHLATGKISLVYLQVT
jgi:hypothetical protein